MKFWKLFAICPFWQRDQKQPPPHRALPYDATAGAPHSAESAPSHGVAPRSLQAPHLHHPTAPRSRLFTPLHPCRSMMPGYASSHHAVPAPIRNTAPVPLHGAVRVSTQGAVPAPHHAAKPHAAHSTAPGPLAPLGTAPELPEVWKQKSDQNCNFFAIGNCRRCSNHGSSPENEANDRSVPHFHFTGDEKEPLIAKMLQKRQDFCFRKANYRNRSRFRNETIAKRGQIPR